MVSMFGGSVEDFGDTNRPGISMVNGSSLALFGTYFETMFLTGAGAVGVSADARSNVTVNVHAAQVYLSNLARFVSMEGATGTLNGRGTTFVCGAEATATNPIAYYWGSSPSVDIDLSGDSWSRVAHTGALYRRDFVAHKRVRVSDPHSTPSGRLSTDYHHTGRRMKLPLGVGMSIPTTTTANRPTDALAGDLFYDVTIGKLIIWSGTTWRDALNAAV